MRTIKTYSKGAPFYNASGYRNVAFCTPEELGKHGLGRSVVTIRFWARFRISRQSGIIVKVTSGPIFGWATAHTPKSVVKVGSKIETSPANAGEQQCRRYRRGNT